MTNESPKLREPYRAKVIWNPSVDQPDLSPEPLEGISTGNIKRRTVEAKKERKTEESN